MVRMLGQKYTDAWGQQVVVDHRVGAGQTMSPDILEVLAKGGSEPVGNSQREANEFLKAEIERWGKVIKQAMVTVQ